MTLPLYYIPPIPPLTYTQGQPQGIAPTNEVTK